MPDARACHRSSAKIASEVLFLRRACAAKKSGSNRNFLFSDNCGSTRISHGLLTQ
jgi:hypothetical protein